LTSAPLAEIAPPFEFHVARQELERKFEIFLFAESARMELQNSAKESTEVNLQIPV
jgi:hypothetical protein